MVPWIFLAVSLAVVGSAALHLWSIRRRAGGQHSAALAAAAIILNVAGLGAAIVALLRSTMPVVVGLGLAFAFTLAIVGIRVALDRRALAQ